MSQPENQSHTKIVTFSEYGSADVLRIESEAQTTPGPGEVKLRMSAVALNRANSMFREGTYVYEATFPSRIGTEGVGTIVGLGEGVTDWTMGQRVNLLPPENESRGGYAAEYVIVPISKLLPTPKGMSDRMAATAWVPFLTLYHTFVEQKQAAEGRWIVLPAASSSVALAANRLARHLGAKTIGLTRTREKQSLLEQAGYDALVISGEENVSTRIMEITSGGADFIFDPVGGPALETLAASIKPGGEINVYGALDTAATPLPVFALMNSGAKISCYMVYELLNDPIRLAKAVDYFMGLFETGQIAPVADDNEFSLTGISEAFRHMESNTQFGKIIVTV
ncbi:MAG: zinc-binding dehydrogenase [Sneathiella sp.]